MISDDFSGKSLSFRTKQKRLVGRACLTFRDIPFHSVIGSERLIERVPRFATEWMLLRVEYRTAHYTVMLSGYATRNDFSTFQTAKHTASNDCRPSVLWLQDPEPLVIAWDIVLNARLRWWRVEVLKFPFQLLQ